MLLAREREVREQGVDDYRLFQHSVDAVENLFAEAFEFRVEEIKDVRGSDRHDHLLTQTMLPAFEFPQVFWISVGIERQVQIERHMGRAALRWFEILQFDGSQVELESHLNSFGRLFGLRWFLSRMRRTVRTDREASG